LAAGVPLVVTAFKRPFLFVDVQHPPNHRCQIRIRFFFVPSSPRLVVLICACPSAFPKVILWTWCFLTVTRDVIAVTLLDFSPALRRVAGLSNMLFACLAYSRIMPSSHTSLAPLSFILEASSPTTPLRSSVSKLHPPSGERNPGLSSTCHHVFTCYEFDYCEQGALNPSQHWIFAI